MTFKGFCENLLLLSCLFLFPSCNTQQNPAQESNVVNDTADDFALLDQDGKFHELYYYSDKKAVVLISQGVACPILRKSIPYLHQLQKEFEPRGVLFLMINANPQDDRNSIKQEDSQYGINIPILKDESQVITESLHMTRTAEAVVIKPADWTVVYRGAISSQFGYDAQTIGIQHEYLKDALKAVIENGPVPQPQSSIKGCLMNIVIDKHVPSYNREIFPILSKKCLQCHVEGGIAPWSMDNYQKVKGWAPMIREVLRTGRMPPWQADPNYGKFKGDLSLTPSDMRILVHWVEAGAPNAEGRDSLADTPHVKSDGWPLGQPDLIFKLKSPQQILPADGSDQFRFIEADKPVKDDLWVRAIYWRPSNLKVVHHGNLVVQVPSQEGFPPNWVHASGMDTETGQIVDGYSPGTGAFVLPPGTGYFIPKGSSLYFRMHYITTGKPEGDDTQVGLYLYKNRPPHMLSVLVILNRALKIPPGTKVYTMMASHVFKQGVILYALQPHMHYRGRSMKFSVQYPDGKTQILLSVPNYKFRWQYRYILKVPIKLPAGSRVTIEGTYDNSAQNPDNPDSNQEVVYGPLSTNEMFVGILYYVRESAVKNS